MRSYVTVQVIDRAGRLVPRANISIDATGAGGSKGAGRQWTDANGELTTSFLAPRSGTVNIVAWLVGSNDEPIYGAHAFRVIDRGTKTGARFTTSTGRVLSQGPAGVWKQVGTASARARVSLFGFDVVSGWLPDLAGIFAPKVAAVASEESLSPPSRVRSIAANQGFFPAVLAIGPKPVGSAETLDKVTVGPGPVQVYDPKRGSVIGNATGNVIGNATGNVIVAASPQAIAAGGGNVIGNASGNFIGNASGTFIGNASGNIVPAIGGPGGGSGFIVAGGATLVPTPGSHGLIAIGNHLIGDNGSAILSDRGGSLISDKGAGLIGQAGSN
jgi:hypothetical protein